MQDQTGLLAGFRGASVLCTITHLQSKVAEHSLTQVEDFRTRGRAAGHQSAP